MGSGHRIGKGGVVVDEPYPSPPLSEKWLKLGLNGRILGHLAEPLMFGLLFLKCRLGSSRLCVNLCLGDDAFSFSVTLDLSSPLPGRLELVGDELGVTNSSRV